MPIGRVSMRKVTTMRNSKKAKQNLITRFIRKSDGLTSMQVALGCAGVALAATFILAPQSGKIAEHIALQQPNADQFIDRTVTGSIDNPISSRGKLQRYTVRRSVLQKDPSATCIIYADGSRKGDC